MRTTHNMFDVSLFEGRAIQKRDKLLTDQGTIVVTRQDGKPLHFYHLRAMGTTFQMHATKYESTANHKTPAAKLDINVYLAMTGPNQRGKSKLIL
jgi:hypothetical protein